MSSQGNVEGHVFQKQAWRPLNSMFYFDFLSWDDSVCKKLEKLNHNFNYPHTSLTSMMKDIALLVHMSRHSQWNAAHEY